MCPPCPGSDMFMLKHLANLAICHSNRNKYRKDRDKDREREREGEGERERERASERTTKGRKLARTGKQTDKQASSQTCAQAQRRARTHTHTRTTPTLTHSLTLCAWSRVLITLAHAGHVLVRASRHLTRTADSMDTTNSGTAGMHTDATALQMPPALFDSTKRRVMS